MSERHIAINSAHVQTVEISNDTCKLTFPKYHHNALFEPSYKYSKSSKEFEECMRIYNKIKTEH